MLQIQDKVLGLGMEGRAGALQQQPPQAVADRPILFDEDKAAIQADEFGEQHRPLRGMSTQTSHTTYLHFQFTLLALLPRDKASYAVMI